MSIRTILYNWGKQSPENLAELKQWFDEAVQTFGENQGAVVTQATTSSNSFTLSLGLRIDQWLTILGEIIDAIENDKPLRRSKTKAQFH